MIEDKDKFFRSNSAGNIISRELAEELYRTTKLSSLKPLLEKKVIVVPASVREEIKATYQAKISAIEHARKARRTKGGRKRIPDPRDPELLQGEEKKRWQNRKWQRDYRAKVKLGKITPL